MKINLLRQYAEHVSFTGMWLYPLPIYLRIRSDNQRTPYFWLRYLLPGAHDVPKMPKLDAARAYIPSGQYPRIGALDRARKVGPYRYAR